MLALCPAAAALSFPPRPPLPDLVLLISCEQTVWFLLLAMLAFSWCVPGFPLRLFGSSPAPAAPKSFRMYPAFRSFLSSQPLRLVLSFCLLRSFLSFFSGLAWNLFHSSSAGSIVRYLALRQGLGLHAKKLSTSFLLHTADKKLNHSLFFYSNALCWK